MADQWLDGATRVPGESSGPSTGGGDKILHHTTEGGSAAGAISAYRSHRGWPTLTAEWTGARLKVYQHMRLNQMARALEHPAGTPETNRANVVQIEHVGFTSEAARLAAKAPASLHVSRWPDERWAAMGALCREIEAVTGCPPVSAVPLSWWDAPQRLSGASFVSAKGHIGHVHAANNHHTDGTGFEIEMVLVIDDRPFRNLTEGMNGPDVRALQMATRLRAIRCGRKDRAPIVDGMYGRETARDAAFAAFILGVGDSQGALIAGGLSAYVQGLIRDPSKRNATQVRRAAKRRELHCNKGA